MFDKRFSKNEAVAAGQSFKEREYWVKKLSGIPEKTYLAYDHDKNDTPRKIETTEFRFPAEISSKLLWISNQSDPRLLMVLVASVVVLLNKYTGNEDIVFGMPIYKQEIEGAFINSTLALRYQVQGGLTFKELLYLVKQTIDEAVLNQNYPIKTLLYELNLSSSEEEFPLFDVAVLLENIQEKKYIRHIPLNMIFSFRRTGETVEGIVEFNSSLYDKTTIERLIEHYLSLLRAIFSESGQTLSRLNMLPGEERDRLLYHFNDTDREYPKDKTLHRLFEEQVEKTPENTAISYCIDLSDIFEDLNAGEKKSDDSIAKRYESCCFRKNPHIYHFEDTDVLGALELLNEEKRSDDLLVRTHRHNYVCISRAVLFLADCFDGKTNAQSLFRGLRKIEANATEFRVISLVRNDYSEISKTAGQTFVFGPESRFETFIQMIKVLYKSNLIELVDFHSRESEADMALIGPGKNPGSENVFAYSDNFAGVPADSAVTAAPTGACTEGKVKSPVLLLGDTVETASTGLLYLASYLRRHSIAAYVQWNDPNRTSASMKKNIIRHLSEIRPQVVGVSMKWFPHIARVLETCKIVKEYDPSIEVVVGGDSASYFKDNLTPYDCIDYVIRGDGEVPLLEICLGREDIPNCSRKKGGRIIETPTTYVQDEKNNAEIFLSHLEEIFVSKKDPYSVNSFFISTGKGCPQQCFYCAGCRDNQVRVFNRKKPFLRDVAAVRKDIVAARKYTTTFMFDFDLPLYHSSLDYYRKIWEGIDLSHHFCEFYFWDLPSPELIDLMAGTFKYIYLSIDLCSLSERHRKFVQDSGWVKPQPTDEEILLFFDRCERCNNVEVGISQIAGLPYFSTEDMKKSNEMLSTLIERYSCFNGLGWGRLHAQPGAPLTGDSEAFGMVSATRTFEDFLQNSELNLKEEEYPSLVNFNYPYIYYKDDRLNSEVTRFYLDTNKKMAESRRKQARRLIITRDVTYRELNERAGRLAGRLRGAGVTPDTAVGMVLSPSQDLITGMFGILKAGGAYLPIDPEIPDQRKEYILRDSGVRLVLTDNDIDPSAGFIPGGIEVVNVCGRSAYAEETGPLEPVNQPSDLAYVIYTSGSTGRPKGVMVEHRQVVNTLVCRKEEYRLNADVTALQLFSYAFDGFVTGFFTPIIAGGRVVLLSKESIADIEKVIDVLAANRVTHFISIPVLYQVILDNITEEKAASLKVVTLAGDKVHPRVLEKTAELNKNMEIANEYGITEAAVMSTIHRHQEKDTRIKIGRPVWNTGIYITGTADPSQLVPIGVYGEMCIAGAGVSRGYMNNPDLTAEKFVEDPFAGDRKMFKTGDFARWLPDGNIEFKGRMDYQVKIRGFRIELGEIERQLKKHPDIKDAVVTVGRHEGRDKYLCAYIVCEKPVQNTQLKEYLSSYLPDYMIPSYFVFLAQLPLSPNGKVDRKRLPLPEMTASAREYAAPRNPVEEQLVVIWADVLDLKKESIGIDASFFELGGHSLSATVLSGRIHKELETKIPMTELFKAPDIRNMAAYIGTAVVEEQAFVSIGPAGTKDYYPLSSAQYRLYILQEIDPHSTPYNISIMLDLEGEIAAGKLEETFRLLIHRHESLRTAFEIVEGTPMQKIYPPGEVPFDIRRYPAAENRQTLSSGDIVQNFVQPFDLARVPLLRVGLLEVEPLRHVLMIDMHHIISDALSLSIMAADFDSLYNGRELPALKLQYKDYSEWQHNRVEGGLLKEQEEYWLKEFAGEIPVLDLPYDYPRPPVQSFDGREIDFSIPKADADALKTIAAEENVTMFMLILSLFYVMLVKVSGQDDIVVGTDQAGRNHVDLEAIIGMFVNTLPLRNFPAPQKSVKEFLAEVKERSLNAFDNQDYQFEDLVEKLLVNRDAARNPVFDVMFSFLKLQPGMGEVPPEETGLKQKTYDYESKTAMFDLTLNVRESAEHLLFTFEYCTELFKKETIERFIGYFRRVVSAVTAPGGREQKISQIAVISEEEKKQVLFRFNSTGKTLTRDKNFAQLFEEQAAGTPDKIAAVSENRYITYRELNRTADRIARLLSERGVSAGTFTALYLERSIAMTASIIGVFKAGGAYLPIDLDYPRNRVQYILEDSEAPIVLTETTSPETLRQVEIGNRMEVVCLDDPRQVPIHLAENPDAAAVEKRADHLAYMIYTSGTTGKPKGVMIHQLGMLNHLYAKIDDLAVTGDDIIAQTASACFDISVWQFLAALLVGGRTFIIDKDTVLEARTFLQVLRQGEVTVLESVPSLMTAFLEAAAGEVDYQLDRLRWMVPTGEPLGVSLVREWYRYYPRIKLVNAYGPTEASDDITHYIVDECPPETQTTIPIGKPLQNLHIYILDNHSALCPVGVKGEICVAGIGVGKGYWKDAEKTRKSFIPNPFLEEIGDDDYAVLYRTGDTGYFRSDGTVECLGRLDDQVKIRGNRIELGEIERRLLNHDEIKEAVVSAKETETGNKYLCAYIVPHGGGGVDGKEAPTDLKGFLAVDLPGYMIPSHFVPLEQIPLTPNGKLDRNALPGPAAVETVDQYIAPRNETEEKLAEIWTEVLGVKRAGITDNFFEVGGDSIKAIQAAARLKRYHLQLAVTDLFLHPVFGDLAKYVTPAVRVIDQGVVEGEVELTPVQRQFFNADFADRHHYNFSMMYHSKEGFERTLLEKLLAGITTHHDALRMVYRTEGGRIVQGNRNLEGKLFNLEIVPIDDNADIEKEIQKEAGRIQGGIDLAVGPLLQSALFKTSAGEYLMIAVHHLVIDGISWRILTEDIAAGYHQLSRGETVKFQDKTDSFKYWAQRLKEYAEGAPGLHGHAVPDDLEYWKGIEETEIESLPRDHGIGKEKKKIKHTTSMDIELGAAETGKLLTEVNLAYNTEINDILLTALGLSVKEWTSNEKMLINLEGHGRESIFRDMDVSRTVGWFTSEYPVLLDMEKCEDLSYTVKFVKETLRGIPGRGISYGILRYLTPPEKKQGFEFKIEPEINFNYFGQFGRADNNGAQIEDNNQSITMSQMDAGESTSPEMEQAHTLNINGMIVNGKLTVSFVYNKYEYDKQTIAALSGAYKSNLSRIIEFCSRREQKELTPSDFDYSDMDIDELEELKEDLSEII